MKRPLLMLAMLSMAALAKAADAPPAAAPRVTGIRAVSRNGQTFVTWKDVAEGEAGAAFRYSLYRSDKPITAETLAQAELCYPGVLNNSCKQFGYAFTAKDRLDPTKPTFVIEEGGQPLPMWSGLAVRTVLKNGKSFYAVMVTDEKYQPVGAIVAGESALIEAVDEQVAPIQPIRLASAKDGTAITGKPGLPLHLSLHGSQATGGAASSFGDTYLYFGTAQMGWRDGLPGLFSVYEKRSEHLILFLRDCIENPRGVGAIETCWFGYYCVPVGAAHQEPRAYPFTENRLAWAVDWTIRKFQADANRVYSVGQSMGGMGSTQWAFHHPEIFAAVYPRLGRVRQSWMPGVGLDIPASMNRGSWKKPAPMFDGKTDYFLDKMDAVKFVAGYSGDLPFYGFCWGRQDWVETWQDQIDMVKALTASRHGFAFSWNNDGHNSEGAKAMALVNKYYPATKFSRDRSYPAFGNSSINQNMGNGDRADGDLVGGINLGFSWSDVVDEPGHWSASLSNDLAQADMTVDVTPRRCQKFKVQAGEKFKWTNSAGGAGDVAADPRGLVTVEKVTIKPGAPTTLVISKN